MADLFAYHCGEHAHIRDRTHNASVVMCPHVCGIISLWDHLDVRLDSLVELLAPFKDGMPHGRWDECDGGEPLYYDPSDPNADRVVSEKMAKVRLKAKSPRGEGKAEGKAAIEKELKRLEVALEDHLVDDAKDRAELERLAQEELGPALRKLLAAAHEVKAARDKVIAHLAPKVVERDKKYPGIVKKIDPEPKPAPSRASKRKKTD